jgi:hypothetical protein
MSRILAIVLAVALAVGLYIISQSPEQAPVPDEIEATSESAATPAPGRGHVAHQWLV